jgi:hydroxymethylpyrimidine pyrophosphatase-like HAD family hydrolase
MRFMALATDYDGTLASGGVVAEQTWEAMRRLRASGRKLILVTGRDLDDLRNICPDLELFHRVVAENGGVLYRPATREQKLLASPPPKEFIQALRDRGVAHLGVGQTIIGTVRPYETVVVEAIADLRLELQVIFNKDAVMVLPTGINKATGLKAALDELGLSPHNVVAIGDAENDYAFLQACECSAAMANALPRLKKHADILTAGEEGQGVIELIDELLADDLRRHDKQLSRHRILLGRKRNGRRVKLSPYGTIALIAGPSAGGKSTTTTGLLERLARQGYQFCVLDPEGDYQNIGHGIVLGDTDHTPSAEEVEQLLRQPGENVVVNMMHIPLSDRALFCTRLMGRLQELRAETGRPHWLVFDEAHHLFPANWTGAPLALPRHLETALFITVHPGEIAPIVLEQVNVVLAVGRRPKDTLAEFASVVGQTAPRCSVEELAQGEALAWVLGRRRQESVLVEIEPGRSQLRRHHRKYVEGLLIPERSFYFRGPEGKLNLRAHNLILFVELAEGVDDETWLYHLHRGDYSRWFREVIGDETLAEEAAEIESQKHLAAAESREQISAAIQRHYTLPDNPSLPRISKR